MRAKPEISAYRKPTLGEFPENSFRDEALGSFLGLGRGYRVQGLESIETCGTVTPVALSLLPSALRCLARETHVPIWEFRNLTHSGIYRGPPCTFKIGYTAPSNR